MGFLPDNCGRCGGQRCLRGRSLFRVMSLDQPNPYKALILTRRHAESLYDLTDEESAAVMTATTRVARAVRKASGCEGLNLVQSNGRVGQQDVFYFHMHILPRSEGDNVQLGCEQ